VLSSPTGSSKTGSLQSINASSKKATDTTSSSDQEARRSIERLASWLQCPLCRQGLDPFGALVLGCSTGHRFDVNKRGYISLLAASERATGDTPEMLDARALVLESGTYSPIAAAIRQLSESPSRIVDSGCGTGYYLRRLLASDSDSCGLAMDLSPVAVSRAIRGYQQLDGLVANVWKPLPIRDNAADLVLNVFAPRNLREFARILAPDGRLIVVVPQAEHLGQLRARGDMLDVPADKSDSVIHAAKSLFEPDERIDLSFEVSADELLAAGLREMGPAAHHSARLGAAPEEPDRPGRDAPVTISVELIRFRALGKA
jgi:23S rRNA (guanine745-N1)-methyltransferase